MKLFFGDDISVSIHLNDKPVSQAFRKVMKNLQYATIPFREWDNPYRLQALDYETRCRRLFEYGRVLAIDVDLDRAVAYDQPYFNELHKIYEFGYPKSDGNPSWLDFHEFIHLCEFYTPNMRKWVSLNYREQGGLVEQPMQAEWLETLSNAAPAGSVNLIWSELGKSPFHYWENKEPNDIERMCQLAKPWLIFKPQVHIALEDIDGSLRYTKHQQLEFNEWWKDYEKPWCEHWGIESWNLKQMFGFNTIGHVDDLDTVKQALQNNHLPTKMRL
jgi:hypothetical protein